MSSLTASLLAQQLTVVSEVLGSSHFTLFAPINATLRLIQHVHPEAAWYNWFKVLKNIPGENKN